MHLTRVLAALLMPGALLITGCGGKQDDKKITVPAGAIAAVNDTAIPKAEFDRWLSIGLKASGQTGPTGAKNVPFDPPRFEKCAAHLAKADRPAGERKPKRADLVRSCESQYEGTRQQVIQMLVTREWLRQEADKLDVKLSDAEVQKNLDAQLKTSFPRREDRDAYLKNTGMTLDDMRERIRIDLLSQKLAERSTPDKPVTDKDLRDYYRKNRKRLGTPESRDTYVILTRTRAAARTAARKLRAGEPVARVVKRYSTDEPTRQAGGRTTVADGQIDKNVQKVLFAVDAGQVAGPVKGQRGWFVFRVIDINKAAPAAKFETLKESLRTQILAERRGKANMNWAQELSERYSKQTVCAERFTVMGVCGNYKMPEIQIDPQAGATPHGQAPAAPQDGPPPAAGRR